MLAESVVHQVKCAVSNGKFKIKFYREGAAYFIKKQFSSDSNGIWTHNHLVHKQTFNHLVVVTSNLVAVT